MTAPDPAALKLSLDLARSRPQAHAQAAPLTFAEWLSIQPQWTGDPESTADRDPTASYLDDAYTQYSEEMQSAVDAAARPRAAARSGVAGPEPLRAIAARSLPALTAPADACTDAPAAHARPAPPRSQGKAAKPLAGSRRPASAAARTPKRRP